MRDALIQPMIDDMKARGIAEESEGALIVRVAEPDDKKEVPPLILIKSDGAVMYGTTDLATIVDRVRSHDPDLILYVVDQRQHLHFEQVFRAARRAGLNGRVQMEHLGFGTMNGPDGKPFKTRAGGVMKLQDLIAMATEEATKRLNEAGPRRRLSGRPSAQQIAAQVGIAALKFADLSNHRIVELHLRSRALHALRGQDRPLPAVRGGAHQIAAAQGRGAGRCTGPPVAADRHRAAADPAARDDCPMP